MKGRHVFSRVGVGLLGALLLGLAWSGTVVPLSTEGQQPDLSLVAATTAKLMVVGDSISQGNEGDFTWRYRLKNHLASSGVSADFVGPWPGTTRIPAAYPPGWPGVPIAPVRDGAYRPGIGFTDSQHLSQWGWQMHQARGEVAPNVAQYAPDYLLVELGFNDLAWGVNDPGGVLSDLIELVTNARIAKPNIKILVANVVHRTPLENLPGLPQTITDYNNLLAGAIASIATTQSPVVLVNVDANYLPTRDTYDGLHPNVRGEYSIAQAFANQLSSRFGVGSSFGAIPSPLPADLTPAVPASITAVRDGTKVNISWNHSFAATGYRLFRRDVTAGESFTAYPYAVAADAWTEAGLPAGHRFEFYAKALHGDYASADSATASVVVKPLPEVPNLTVTTHPDRPYTATLSWDPVPEAEDYHVYAAPSCDLLPPDADQYQLAQWALGNTTTWTQEYLFGPCTNYVVVASRNGGDGPRQWPGVRAWPYQNNLYHFYARNRYLDTGPDNGDVRAETQVAAGSDRGIVVMRGFIRDKDTLTSVIGDHRQFNQGPYASSKIGVAWDTSTGEVGIYVHRSCILGTTFLWQTYTWVCHDARPIRFVADATAYGDSNTSPYNYVSVSKSNGDLIVAVSAINAWESANPLDFGRINARIRMTPAAGTYNVSMVGDKFPAWEFYRYPRTDTFPALDSGTFRTLGTRDQTSIGDLKGSQSTCTSTGEVSSQVTRPMSCS